MIEKQEDGSLRYSSESPDEIALIKSASAEGIILSEVKADSYTIHALDNEEKYNFIKQFPFNST